MLADIRGAIKDNDAIYLFLDNATYHLSSEVKEVMENLNIKPIYNVAYSFKYNPCERMWA